jgi:hypothetical protein
MIKQFFLTNRGGLGIEEGQGVPTTTPSQACVLHVAVARITPNFTFRCCAVPAGRKRLEKRYCERPYYSRSGIKTDRDGESCLVKEYAYVYMSRISILLTPIVHKKQHVAVKSA